MSIDVLALDLERTLVDDAYRGRPRPGLREFLEFCYQRFDRIAIYTTVDEETAREVLMLLDRDGYLPTGFYERLEFIHWEGEYKDLSFIPRTVPERVVIVDDDESWILPGQREYRLPIAPWDGGSDDELERIQQLLVSK